MKRLFRILFSVLVCLSLSVQYLHADDTLRITEVKANYLDKTTEVTRKVMEIDGGLAELINLSVETTGGGSTKTYQVLQYDSEGTKVYISSSKPELSIDPSDLDPGRPVYISVKSGSQQTTRLLNFRIHVGETQKQFPDDIYSQAGSGLVIDMASKLPGCKFSFLPFVIPLNVKTYADGRIVLGIGLNASDTKFWANALQGKFPTQDFKDVRRAVLDEEDNSWTSKPKNMGLLFSVSGWAEGNVNAHQPMRGKIMVYAGTGWATGGQYAFLTWDVVVTIGGNGAFEFSIIYNETESSREFQWDRILLGLIGSLEAFGGIGLYNIASVGIYGAGSLGLNFELLPDQTVDSLIISGEFGFKVKVFCKSILTFTLISGSYDFLDQNGISGVVNFADSGETIRNYLLENNYGNSKGQTISSEGKMVWHGQIKEEPEENTYEEDVDFAHLLAENIYPDSKVQIINTGGTPTPQMNIVFLGADSSRVKGNQSVLMNSYYDISKNFVSDPSVIDYDGTADFEPAVYHDDQNIKTYLVWQNATEEIREDMTLSEIADRTEVAFKEFWIGSDWKRTYILTNYAGTGITAAGANVSSDEAGEPVVTWFTTSTDDPMGLTGTHEIWLATRDGKNQWYPEKQFEVSGMINDVRSFWYKGASTISVSMTDESGISSVSLWQNGKKIWEKTNAANGQFGFMGYNSRVYCWYQEGRLYMMREGAEEAALTPEDMIIPTSEYHLFGKFGSGTVMLVGRSAADSEQNAFAIFSTDGGTHWSKVSLTDIDSHALVDHISVAYTNENEPIVVYSVQNYLSNFDESRTVASNYFNSEPAAAQDNVPLLSLSGDDPRFTDTQADLYIKARKSNSHITITEASVNTPEELVPGKDAEIEVTLLNKGLYPISSVDIFCNGSQVGQLTETVQPGKSGKATVKIPIPSDTGEEEINCTLECTSRETKFIESRIDVTIPGGDLSATVDHYFEDMQEKLVYSVVNDGYTTKKFTVLVRDEDRGVEISRETFALKGGETCDGAAVAPSGMYVRDGCEKNVTLYVLFGGEDYDSATVDASRIKSVVPLEEVYGQTPPQVQMPDIAGRPADENSGLTQKDLLISAGAALICALGFLYWKKRKAADSH